MPSGPRRRSTSRGNFLVLGPSAQARPLITRSMPLIGLIAKAANSVQKRAAPEALSSTTSFERRYSVSPKKYPPQVVVDQSLVDGCSVSAKNSHESEPSIV